MRTLGELLSVVEFADNHQVKNVKFQNSLDGIAIRTEQRK